MLASGTCFQGKAFGDISRNLTTSGEVVFNTAMSGYQEVLTDPSYKGQLVCMTYPLIGNYGINDEDHESAQVYLSGLIIKERSRIVSNYRSKIDLAQFLKKQKVMGIEGIDTRALTLELRKEGALQGAIVFDKNKIKTTVNKLLNRNMVGMDLVKEVAVSKPRIWNQRGKFKVVVLDTGVKYNILRSLESRGCKVSVLPPESSLDAIMSERPDGVFLANGPGDPAAIKYVIKTTKQLIALGVPLFGICLGHQLLAQALGAKTYKLKFGHHGANHPVLNLANKEVEITSQNHGFAVSLKHLPKSIKPTHINLNDQTCEGIKSTTSPAFSVQYHPESAPGPHDSMYLFDQFINMIEASQLQHAKT